MPLIQRIPKASGSNLVMVKGTTWNLVVNILERLSKLTVAPPLRLDETQAGPVLSLGQLEDVFIANVQKDGGLNGNKTTAASWTYTIIRLGATIATGVAQDKPRPLGTATYQAGSSGFGLCFYGSDGKVHLWDAGEIYGTGSCP